MSATDELDEAALASVLDSLSIPLIVLDRDGLVLHTNDAADDHFPVMEGDPWLASLPDDVLMAGESALAKARDNVVTTFDLARNGKEWGVTVQPSHVGLVVTAQERSASAAEERRMAEERAHAAEARAEMEHRVNNILSMVPALVKLSLGRKAGSAATREAVVGRISALTAVHSMMLNRETAEAGVSLDAMIEAVLPVHDDGRFVTTGPPVRLATRGSNAVALALHELASNAQQFGALSRPHGRVRIAWAIEQTARDLKLPEGARSVLRLLWSETGGPQIARPPTHRGFGTRIVDRLLESQSGKIEREWLLHGLAVTIDLPLYELGHEPKFAGDLRGAPPRVAVPDDEEAATQIVERAVAAAGDMPPERARATPVGHTGPSEAEIMGRIERIITNTEG